MSQNSISSGKTDIAGHGRRFCLYCFFADLHDQLISDTERLLSGLVRKKSPGCVFHVIITAHSIFNLHKGGSDIGNNIFHLTDIDIAQTVALRPVTVRVGAVDLYNIPVLHKKCPYLPFCFFNQYFSLHFLSSFPCTSSLSEKGITYSAISVPRDSSVISFLSVTVPASAYISIL